MRVLRYLPKMGPWNQGELSLVYVITMQISWGRLGIGTTRKSGCEIATKNLVGKMGWVQFQKEGVNEIVVLTRDI